MFSFTFRKIEMCVKFEELVYLSRSVIRHVYTCLTVLTSDMLRYDILPGSKLYPAIVKNMVSSKQRQRMAIGI